MPTSSPTLDDLLRVVLDVTGEALTILNLGKMLNERYVHHFMSHRIQEQLGLLDLRTFDSQLLLHPEWPTWKKSTGLRFGQYRGVKVEGKKTKKYFPVTKPKGGAGFVDFALGDYAEPSIAIEVTAKHGWEPRGSNLRFFEATRWKKPVVQGGGFLQHCVARQGAGNVWQEATS